MTKRKKRSLKKTTVVDFATYLGVTILFVVMYSLQSSGSLTRSLSGLLIPICCYMSMAVSLNLTVGILGELSLGHAGFMSVGAFSGIIAAMSLQDAIPSAGLRLAIAMVVGAIFAAIVGFLVGMHLLFNLTGSKTADDLHLSETGTAIIKGAQGAVGIKTISTFTAGFILVMVTLFVVLNLVRSRQGRAIMAIRDNEIAAQSIGLHITSYKLMAFVTSAALAGAAGALYGLNYSSLQATKFNFNTSILILVFVVLGGLGNIWGSLVAAAALTILPEALRGMDDLRMLIYSIVLILVMLATNAPSMKAFFSRIQAAFGKKSHEGGKGNAV